MIAVPIPSRESARLDALYRSHILDTPSEPVFDELARLTAYVCRTPMAVISLVDSTRQWFKSVVGLSHTESPRSLAFCAHTILGPDLFIVEETGADERFADHPWVVDAPSIRFYAGVPLITPDGHAIGALAVMDVVSRSLTPEQRAGMQTLAKQVMAQFELRECRSSLHTQTFDSAMPATLPGEGRECKRVEEERSRQEMLLTLMLNTGPGCIKRVAVDGTLVQMNPAGLKLIEACGEQEAVGRSVFDLVLPGHRAAFMRMHQEVIQGAARTLQFEIQGFRGTRRWMETHAVPFCNPVTGDTEQLAMTYDITERKQAEEALWLSRERLQQALQASNTGLWDWNTETGDVNFSKEWKSQLGYAEPELPDRFETWVSRLHPEDRDRAIAHAQAYRDNPVGVFRQDFRLQHKDGSYRWIDSQASFVTEPDGRRVRLLGSHTDITERKQAEEALQLAKFTVDRATEAIYWVGFGAELLDVNEAACTMLGYSKEEFRRMTVHDINPHFKADSWPAYWEETRQRGAVSFESVHQAKDGRLIPIEVNVNFLSYQGRECHCAFVRDITERKQAEQQRAQALHSLQTIMETVPDIIFALDPHGRLSSWNKKMEMVTGYGIDELFLKPALEMVPFEEAGRTAAAIREAFETGYAELEGHLLTKDGRTIPYHWTGAPFTDLQGRVIGITGVGRDITERKKVEQLLAAETQILELLGSDASLPAVLAEICLMIERLSKGVHCSILLLDDDGMHLRHGAAPSLPESYTRAIDGMTIGPSQGSCGTAAFTGRPVVAQDIASDPSWADFRDLALPQGLRTCWSTPILASTGKVLGTFAVYGRTPRQPTGELPLIDRASYLASLAIERKRTEQALRLTQFSIQQAVDAVFWVDAHARILDVNDAACTILGYSRNELISRTVHDIDANFPPEAWPAHWEELKTRTSFSFEGTHQKKDGTVIQTETTVNFLIHEGREYNCAFMRDITDRKQAEAQLHLTQFAIERSADMVFWVAPSSRLLLVNTAACERLGYSKEELLRMAVSDIDPNYQREDWGRHWEELRQVGRLRFETLHRSKSGDVYPVEVVANFLVVDGKEYNFATVRDISDRKRAEEALRMTRFSVERVSDSIFWIDSAARIVDVNEAACRILQYSRQDLLSMYLFDIDPNVTADNWSRLWRDKLEQRTMTFESSQIRRDGTVFPVEVTCNHLRFGEQEFCCAIVRNISERKYAESLLRVSEERFRLVAEATNDILWDWDLVTHEHWWSPNAREKFGYNPNAEPSISAWTDRLHPDDRDHVMALVDRALASDARTAAAEYRFRLEDGSYGHFYDRGQIIRDSAGRAVRMVGAMIDMTFSKRAYASLEEAYRRLQSMSRELQRVESNERRRLSRELHDEVGQLLTALKFDLEAARQAMQNGTASAAGRAQERTIRALETTDELFARLRRVVRALRPPVLEELGLKAALEALVSDTKSRSDLVCAVSIEGEAVDSVEAATIEAALYRMTQELVTNVVRHAQAMTLTVILDVDAQQWKLTVQDDGLGFDPKHESISGMGIRGIRERAEILGGHVDVSSKPGAGTTVMVCIPVPTKGILNEGMNDM